jgi:hypothetical protein
MNAPKQTVPTAASQARGFRRNQSGRGRSPWTNVVLTKPRYGRPEITGKPIVAMG